MSKIGLIIGRELKSKLTNKAFVIMTLLAPVLMNAFIFLMVNLSKSEKADQKVLVLDESGIFKGKLSGNDYVSLVYSNEGLQEAEGSFTKRGFTSVLWVAPNFVEGGAGATKLIYRKSPGYGFQTYLKDQMEKIIYEFKLDANHIDPNVIMNSRLNVKMILVKVDETGRQTDQTGLGYFGFVLGIFMFVFILVYGMMVFRSVMEEKTSRIVEVIVSSVKPFELMMGKIIGVALVGIIQFVAIGIITLMLSSVLSKVFLKDAMNQLKVYEQQKEMVNKKGTNINLDKLNKFEESQEMFDTLKKLKSIDFTTLFICFVLYFIGGYLFYSSIMAAIGSAVDSEADSQQFLMPVMLPLLAGYFIVIKGMVSPESGLVFWGSMIPFTSPIVMMSRISSGVPPWEIAVSLLLLFASFIVTTWVAGKIYRTGILMYGKKTSWREIGKWIFYR